MVLMIHETQVVCNSSVGLLCLALWNCLVSAIGYLQSRVTRHTEQSLNHVEHPPDHLMPSTSSPDLTLLVLHWVAPSHGQHS